MREGNKWHSKKKQVSIGIGFSLFFLVGCGSQAAIEDIVLETHFAHNEAESYRLEVSEVSVRTNEDGDELESSIGVDSAMIFDSEMVHNQIEMDRSLGQWSIQTILVDEEEYINVDDDGWFEMEEGLTTELEGLGVSSLIQGLNFPDDESQLLDLIWGDYSEGFELIDTDEEDYILHFHVEGEEAEEVLESTLTLFVRVGMLNEWDASTLDIEEIEVEFHIDRETSLHSYISIAMEAEMTEFGENVYVSSEGEMIFSEYNDIETIETPDLSDQTAAMDIDDLLEDLDESSDRMLVGQQDEELARIAELFEDETDEYEVEVIYAYSNDEEMIDHVLAKAGNVRSDAGIQMSEGYFHIHSERDGETNVGELFWNARGEFINDNDSGWEPINDYSSIGTHSFYPMSAYLAAYVLTEPEAEINEEGVYAYTHIGGYEEHHVMMPIIEPLLDPFMDHQQAPMVDATASDFMLTMVAEFDENNEYLQHFSYTISQGDISVTAAMTYDNWNNVETSLEPEGLSE